MNLSFIILSNPDKHRHKPTVVWAKNTYLLPPRISLWQCAIFKILVKIPPKNAVSKKFIYTNNRQLPTECDIQSFLFLMCLTWQLRNSPLKMNIQREKIIPTEEEIFLQNISKKILWVFEYKSYRSYISYRNKIPTGSFL